MSDIDPAGRSPVQAGVLITLATLGVAALVGLIAVFDADTVGAGFGRGLGIALAVFLAGGTIAVALACLRRRKAEFAALLSIVAAGLATDLLALAIWREIDSEAYAKVAGVAFVWSFLLLVVLGLTLAVGVPRGPARPLYQATVAATLLAALIVTWLIASAGTSDPFDAIGSQSAVPSTITTTTISGTSGSVPYYEYGVGYGIRDDWLLRVLGAVLVLLAVLWFAALAASRLGPSEPGLRR